MKESQSTPDIDLNDLILDVLSTCEIEGKIEQAIRQIAIRKKFSQRFIEKCIFKTFEVSI